MMRSLSLATVAVGLIAMTVPALAQNPPLGPPARSWNGSTPLTTSNTRFLWGAQESQLSRIARYKAAAKEYPGPFKYRFSPDGADRAVMVVKYSRQANLAALDNRLRAAVDREISDTGYTGVRVIGRDCSNIREGRFTRECTISLRLRR